MRAHIKRLIPSLLLLCLASPLHSQTISEIMAVVSPAWIEKSGQRFALKPGIELENGDKLITSTGGRVQVKFNNFTEFQLSADAEFKAHQLDKALTPAEPYQCYIEVIKGAFRYISDVFGPGPQNSNFRVDVGLASVGIRGTDFWGITEGSTDTIVLIEGVIEITPDTGAPITLTDPQSIVQSVHGVGAGPVGQVDMATLESSAAMTSLPSGKGVMQQSGLYQVVLSSLSNDTSADTFAAELNAQGYPAETEFSTGIGRYRVVIGQFETLEDASFFAQNTAKNLGISDAWVKR